MPAAHRIAAFLSSGQLQALTRKARRLLELQQVYLVAAPSRLAEASHIKNFRAGVLYLSADNAAVAAKLRQIAPRLLVSIRKREPEITGIQVDVQVTTRPPDLLTQLKKRPLSAETIEDFRKLAEAVSDPELKSALAGFARRHDPRRFSG